MLPPVMFFQFLSGAVILAVVATAMVPTAVWVFLAVAHKLGLKPREW